MINTKNEETKEKEDTISEDVASEEATLEAETPPPQDAPTEEDNSEDQSGPDPIEEEKLDEDSDEEEASLEDEEAGDDKYQALNAKYLRLYAEFENFRRRTAKETMEVIRTANAELVSRLIPTLENFERAFSTEQKGENLKDFEKGVKMIYNSFKDTLEEAGLEEINPEGEEFDPNLHEAVMQQHHDTVEEDYVAQVYQKGYKLNSKILKHAMVIVSKGKK